MNAVKSQHLLKTLSLNVEILQIPKIKAEKKNENKALQFENLKLYPKIKVMIPHLLRFQETLSFIVVRR